MKESFILYTEYAKHIGLLNMEQRGVLFTAIMCYQTDEELPEMDNITSMAFSFIKSDIDRAETSYQKKVEANRENGKRGGRPKKEGETEKPKKPNGFFEEANCFEEKPKKPNGFFENPNEHERDNEHDNDLSSVCPTEPRACACEGTDGSDGAVEDFLWFMREHSQIQDDLTNPSLIASVDFKRLSQKISESRFLQSRHSLTWLIGNYRKIVADAYRDYPPRATPNAGEESQSDFIRRKYLEAAEEDERDAKENGLAVN